MERNVLKWSQEGEVVKKAEFGSLRIFEVVEPNRPKDAARDSSPHGSRSVRKAILRTPSSEFVAYYLQPIYADTQGKTRPGH